MLRSLDLFSGYGGLTLALEEWCKPIAYVEIEEYPQRIIAERMADGTLPRARILSDVKNIKGAPGICDIIVGGFPCQDISVAGNGKGLEGERSGLFFQIARLTKEIQPAFVFLENVPAIRTRGLQSVIQTFSKMGYDCRWTIVSANYVGAPHQRDRWFLLAHAHSELSGNKWQAMESGNKKMGQKPETISQFDGFTEQMAHPSGSRWIKNSEPCGPETQYSTAKISSGAWQIEPSVGRVADGITFRMDRLKALGNGVVPQQARLAFKYLIGEKL